MTTIRTAAFADLDTTTLYALLRLRVDVFVVEQKAAYPELDGRDTEPGTLHVWAEGEGAPGGGTGPIGYLRVLSEEDGTRRIGRVCTAIGARRRGIGDRLMAAALEAIGDVPSTLDSQTYALEFYRRYGYEPCGPEYTDEDGIPHVPMRRGGATA